MGLYERERPIPVDMVAGGVRGAVVVAMDGRLACDTALRYAAEEALLRRVELVIVCNYWRPVDPDMDDFDTPENDLRVLAVRRAEEAMRRTFGPTEKPPDYRIVIEHGDLVRPLVRCSKEARLLVVGSSVLRTFPRMMHGPSRNQALLRRAAAPVVFVSCTQ